MLETGPMPNHTSPDSFDADGNWGGWRVDYIGGPATDFGIWEIGVGLGMAGLWGLCYAAFADAFPRLRVTLMKNCQAYMVLWKWRDRLIERSHDRLIDP